MDLARFGVNLRKLLALHELTGGQAAKVLGTTPQAVSAWLQGRRPPSSNALFAIGQVFGIDPTRLANEDTQTLLPVFGDQDRYAETQARLKKQLGSLKAVR
jgi:transcriptional regulator with XRE-family HTH domain